MQIPAALESLPRSIDQRLRPDESLGRFGGRPVRRTLSRLAAAARDEFSPAYRWLEWLLISFVSFAMFARARITSDTTGFMERPEPSMNKVANSGAVALSVNAS